LPRPARFELDAGIGWEQEEGVELVALDTSLAGLPVEAVAEVLGVSEGTVMRDWRFARAWLARTLKHEGEG